MALPRRGARPTADRRGQAETISVVLILSITLIGAIVAVSVGTTSLDAGRIASQEGSIEHAMTQLDSQAAIVALGDSEGQRVPLASTGQGGYHVDANAGWINITHHNFKDSGNNEGIYNETLGSIVYRKDDKVIAYQGGGVWVVQSNTSRMLSPPEFHYRSATLTLPVIRVNGSDGVGGSGIVAEISQVTRARAVFPNSSQQYGGTSDDYVNPIRKGNVTVTIKSEYYQAWAEYFRTRSDGEVTVDHANDTVELELVAPGTVGDFDMPADGNSVEVRGMPESHSIKNFSITLIDDEQDQADFSNMQWSLWAEEGSQQFEIHIPQPQGSINCPTDKTAEVNMYYSPNGSHYHGWTNDSAFEFECEGPEDFNDDGDTEDKRLVVNFTSDVQMEYTSFGGGDLLHFSPGTLINSPTWDQHTDVDHAGEPKSFTSGDKTAINNTTNHYLSLLAPSFDLTVEDGPGNRVNEEASSGNLEIGGQEGIFVKFMQITENRISIELE